MGDNQNPSKIAKHLLKGCCLLNEYCPNGQNIPLLKTRDGNLICVGCTASCKYYAKYGGTEAASKGLEAPSQVASPQQPMAATVPSGGGLGGAVGAPMPPSSGSGCPVSAAVANTGISPVEVGVQGPDLRFGCVYLATTNDQLPRLSGDHYSVKLRVAAPATNKGCMFDTTALKEAVSTECKQLAKQVLIPEHNSSIEISVVSGQEQVRIKCENGSHFMFPMPDCLLLPVVHVTLDAIATIIWERIAASPAAVSLCESGACWMEICVIDGATNETAFRKAFSSSQKPPPDVAGVTMDW